MIDMTKSCEPKSSQLNADSLIGGKSLTIKITKVSGVDGDQPIAISYENDGGKVYMPSKGMRRVLVKVWGNDGATYVGRSLTLFCDDQVMFGGVKVGGIRISHMSEITEPVQLVLTASKTVRKPYTVQPLKTATTIPALTSVELDSMRLAGENAAQEGRAAFLAWYNSPDIKRHHKSLAGLMGGFQSIVESKETPSAQPKD